jgi:PAS domain S-box-containing protein
MRRIAWADTPLGPVGRWPGSLLTALSMLRNSPHPVFIWWGKELVQFYNDACIPILGAKHPGDLGRPGREAWAEAFHLVEPVLLAALEEGKSSLTRDGFIPVARQGFLEECYFDYSYVPIEDEQGGIGGLFSTVIETTEKVINERRLRTLIDLGACAASTPERVCESAAEVLTRNGHDIPFSLLYLVEPEGRAVRLAATSGLPMASAAAPARIDLASEAPWPIGATLTGQSLGLHPIPAALDSLAAGPWPEPAAQAALVPILDPQRERVLGVFIAGLSPRRPFDDAYRDFLGLIARHLGSAISSVQTHVAEQGAALARAQVAEEQFRRLYDSNMIGLLFSDLDGRVLDANDAYLQTVGYSREDLTSQRISWRELTPPEWQWASERAVVEIKAQGFTRPFEKEYLRKDGSRAHILIGSARVESQNRNLTFVVDITSRKRAERALKFIADASVTLASSLDLEQTLQNVAQLLVPELADWCAVDLVQETGAQERVAVAHIEPEKVALAWDIYRRYPLAADAPHGAPYVVRTACSELHPLVTDELLTAVARDQEHLQLLRGIGMRSAMIVPLTTRGQVLGALTFVSTDARRCYGESDLALAEEVARRCAMAVDNARLYSESQQAVRLRDEFLSIASHELRTPLTSLHLHLAQLARQGDGLARDAAAEAFLAKRIGGIRTQSARLARLVDELLDVSRIAQGTLHLQPERLDLAAVVREVVEGMGTQREASQGEPSVRLEAEEGVVGRWDRLRLEQAVSNLLTNAIKYGEGKPITVEARRHGQQVTVAITDRGLGISPQDQERIFGRFERAVSANHYGGLGLGLYITRQIVQAMGGDVSVRSAVGQGSTFTLRLPLEST